MAGHSFTGSFVLGRPFQFLRWNNGLPTGKLDLNVGYEDVSDDPMRNDRLTGAITATQELTGGLQLTLGVVWANRAEYLPDNDSELTARIGLNFKLSPDQKGSND